jgi:hypothetical protein
MNQWIRFFVGTPQRLLMTLGGLIVAYGLVNPVGVGQAVNALLMQLALAIAPFVQPLLTLGVVCIGFGIVWRGVFPKKGGKK